MNKVTPTQTFNTPDGRLDLFKFGNPRANNRILITGAKHGGELGACPRKRDFFKHAQLMWSEQKPAMHWLFQQELSKIRLK